MGTLEEVLSRLKGLESENGKLRERVAELKAKLELSQREGSKRPTFRKAPEQRKPPKEHKKPGRKAGHEASYKKPPPPDQVGRTVEFR